MNRFVLPLVLGVLASSTATAFAGDIQSATWNPGTGSATTLVDGGSPVFIDTVASHGYVEVVTDYATPTTDVVVAYALDFDGGGVTWAESGSTRYHTLDETLVSYEPYGAGTRVTAKIPMVNALSFHPALIDADQKFYVYVGRPGVMTVNPTTGVLGEDDLGVYQANTDMLAHTIVPDDESIVEGVRTPGDVELTVLLDDVVSSDLEYTLSFSGDARLLDALTLPSTVTVLAGDSRATALIAFDPSAALAYPSERATLTVMATSTLGTINSFIRFGGILFDAEPGLPAGTVTDDDCYPTTVPAQQPPASVPTTACGKCVKTSVAVTCPRGWTAGTTTDRIFYYQFKCEDDGTCTVGTSTVNMVATTVSTWTQSCSIPIGLVLRAHQTAFKAKKGHQCCYSIAPSSSVKTYTLPDCT